MSRAPKKGSPFKNNKLGFILGILGGIAGGALVPGLLLILITKNGRKKNADAGDVAKPTAGKASSVQSSPGLPADQRHMSPAVRLGAVGLLPYRVFTMEELDEATNNFDPANLIQENSKRQLLATCELAPLGGLALAATLPSACALPPCTSSCPAAPALYGPGPTASVVCPAGYHPRLLSPRPLRRLLP